MFPDAQRHWTAQIWLSTVCDVPWSSERGFKYLTAGKTGCQGVGIIPDSLLKEITEGQQSPCQPSR